MRRQKLPSGWVKTTLGEVCLPVSTVQPTDTPEVEFTYFDIGGVDNELNRISETKTVMGRAAPNRARQAVQRGDILFSTVRTYLRKVARLDRDYPNAVASTGFAVIRPADGVSSEFLFYQVLSERFLQPLHALQTGTSYPAVRSSDVFAQPIMVPPAPEQRRIAEKLNASLSAVERAERAVLRARERLARYRSSVLLAAVTGELTNTWRTADSARQDKGVSGGARLKRLLTARRTRWEEIELAHLRSIGRKSTDDEWRLRYSEPAGPNVDDLPKIPEGWVWAILEQLGVVLGGLTKNQERNRFRLKIPYLRVANVYANELRLDTVETIGVQKSELARLLLEKGDLLIVEGNGSKDQIGRLAIWDASIDPCVHQNHIIKVRLTERRLGPWVVSWLLSPTGRNYVERVASSTTGLYTLSISKVGRLPIPLPPLPEQLEIDREVRRRLSAADRLQASLERQLTRAHAMRDSLLRDAFAGRLVSQNPKDEPASILLARIRSERALIESDARTRSVGRPKKLSKGDMKQSLVTPSVLLAAFERIGKRPDARRLFDETGCDPEDVTSFYEALRATPAVQSVFEKDAQKTPRPIVTPLPTHVETVPNGRFRLVDLWLEEFRNLKDYTVRFDPAYGLDVVLGWNGTGKSNLFESLVIILRDLHEWSERNRWPAQPMNGYRLSYEIDDQLVQIVWNPKDMKRPAVTRAMRLTGGPGFGTPEPVSRGQLPLPRFVFAYYSGPTNRLAEHFLPMKQAHYVRLREAKADDARTLAELLEQRRFFCAETHHAKYVLLAFSYKEDSKISGFLRDRLRIVGFESALFVIRKPRWAKPGSKATDFWGATGIMRRVMERLRRYAIAPMVIEQTVSDGYRATTEDHYYFYLRDLESLHSFAAEYPDARTFFLALESTDFSELIHDVKIQVSVKATDTEKVSITFHQLSEGEQQLLMVLGLMRFTKSHHGPCQRP